MKLGSDPSCLLWENEFRVPELYTPSLVDGADAYLELQQDAACTDTMSASFQITSTACHSAIWNPLVMFQDTFTALGNAFLLQGELLLSSGHEFLTLPSDDAISFTRPSPLPSCLKSLTSRKKKLTTRFNDFCESILPCGDISVEPLNVLIADSPETEFVSLMARAPATRDLSDYSNMESDVEVHTPTSPSTFNDPDDRRLWRSIQIYDLSSNHARGRIQVRPPEAAFAEARRLLGYTHHDVAEIFTISPSPQDLERLHVQPLLLIAHDDLNFGDDRIAVLLDVELHGPDLDSIVNADRYTTLLPNSVTRDLLLRIAGVHSYCHMQLDRCLVWHRGHLLPLQSVCTYQLQHGDYIRIAVPPFDIGQISTQFAVRACQAGLTQDEISLHYQMHGHDFENFHTADADEQDDPAPDDVQSFIQESFCKIPSFLNTDSFYDASLEPQFSLTDEFIEAIRQRAHVNQDAVQVPEPQLSLAPQSLFVQSLHDALQSSQNVAQLGHRELPLQVESWFTNQMTHRRCHQTRIRALLR